MIHSMTAFASEERTRNGITVSVEIKCVNSRHLDLAIRLPSAHGNMEEAVRQMISSHIQRGRVEIRISIQNETDDVLSFTVNERLADAYYKSLNHIRNRYSLTDGVALDHLLKINGIIEPAEMETDTSVIWNVLEETLSCSLDHVQKMRKAEGDAMKRDLFERTDRIEQYILEIENRSDGLIEIYRERLAGRINELTRGMVEIDPGRIAQEAAFIADKSDISEEITRAKSHLSQFRHIAEAEPPAGRSLNFLLQEFLREFNTMGSKAGNADISHIIVSAKTELEKIREQIQNVE